MKTAFVFPGQGTQYVGMGLDMYRESPAARGTYEEAAEICGADIAELCFSGPEEKLVSTVYQQPAIHCTEIALLRAVQDRGLRPDVCAGFSLGEYAALVCAGIMDFADSLKAVSKRGPIIQAQVAPGKGKMALISGLCADTLSDIVAQVSVLGTVEISNFNSYSRLVISGLNAAVDEACRIAKERGAERVSFLKVSAPFHTSLLREAGRLMAKELGSVVFHEKRCDFIPNVTAGYYSGEDMTELLDKHIWYPVKWLQSVQSMLQSGVELIVEIGPSHSLCSYCREIIEHDGACAKVLSVEKYEDIAELEKIMSN